MDVVKRVTIELENELHTCKAVGDEFRFRDVCVSFEERSNNALACFITAQNTPVSYVRISFDKDFTDKAVLLGDTWERSYGDLEWRKQPYERVMPWYFFAKEGDTVRAYGVRVRPNAMCAWSVEGGEVCLTLDVCNGSRGVMLDGRRLLAAEVVDDTYHTANVYKACKDFCKRMCDDGIFPSVPVYGGNNWYYAYGDSSDEEIVRDAKMLAEASEGLANRPYVVVDDGWEKNRCAGPWDALRGTFKDMQKLARDIRSQGVLPGCWIRPLFYIGCDIPRDWVLRKQAEQGKAGVVLDITVPDAREYVLNGFRLLKDLGYALIKHDFTTRDLLGRYSFECDGFMTRQDEPWHFCDTTRTNAEIIVDFYRDIRKAAADVLIMGCNTLSHLCAGLVEIQRAGDDTSGVEWERTKRMGVNTLAFRMCQHKVFYDIDADCVGITTGIAWEKNRQWLDLVAHSGTPLFVSLSPDCYTKEVLDALRSAFKVNSEQRDICEPIDWTESKTPSEWLINGKKVKFNW